MLQNYLKHLWITKIVLGCVLLGDRSKRETMDLLLVKLRSHCISEENLRFCNSFFKELQVSLT